MTVLLPVIMASINKVKVGSLTRIERSELLRFISDGGGDFNG